MKDREALVRSVELIDSVKSGTLTRPFPKQRRPALRSFHDLVTATAHHQRVLARVPHAVDPAIRLGYVNTFEWITETRNVMIVDWVRYYMAVAHPTGETPEWVKVLVADKRNPTHDIDLAVASLTIIDCASVSAKTILKTFDEPAFTSAVQNVQSHVSPISMFLLDAIDPAVRYALSFGSERPARARFRWAGLEQLADRLASKTQENSLPPLA